MYSSKRFLVTPESSTTLSAIPSYKHLYDKPVKRISYASADLISLKGAKNRFYLVFCTLFCFTITALVISNLAIYFYMLDTCNVKLANLKWSQDSYSGGDNKNDFDPIFASTTTTPGTFVHGGKFNSHRWSKPPFTPRSTDKQIFTTPAQNLGEKSLPKPPLFSPAQLDGNLSQSDPSKSAGEPLFSVVNVTEEFVRQEAKVPQSQKQSGSVAGIIQLEATIIPITNDKKTEENTEAERFYDLSRLFGKRLRNS